MRETYRDAYHEPYSLTSFKGEMYSSLLSLVYTKPSELDYKSYLIKSL